MTGQGSKSGADLGEDLDEADAALLDAVAALDVRVTGPTVPDDPVAPGSSLTWRRLDVLFDAQVASRLLDHTARWLRAEGHGFYTIASAGHEANAMVAAALRPSDPALLHYRSGGFYLARAQQVGAHDGIGDILKGLLAAADEPIAGGRHKVFGHHQLAVIPQTSTIASQLPRAVGVAFAIGRAAELGVETSWPHDAVAVCSFGDASLSHSTAQGAINAAAQMAYEGIAVPLLLVCEDNGLGISVPTPPGWIEQCLSSRPGVPHLCADGTDPLAVYESTEELADYVRDAQRPAILHLRVVRYGGHAGTDVETGYRSAASIRADRRADPIVATARLLVSAGHATPARLRQRILATRALVRSRAAELIGTGRLTTVDEIVEPLSRRRPTIVAEWVTRPASTDRRRELFGALPEDGAPLTLAESVNRTLGELLAADPSVLVFGEDVGAKGGVYGVTRGLQRAAGSHRVFDTLLDEQTILGLALGAGVSGMLPIAEIQYLAYLHNAIDQLRGEAATLSFFSTGQYLNPMVVRIPGYGYQKGFGGHFHNDNALGGLRDIPGVVVASPATGADAAAMLRTCAAAAKADGNVCVFLEPIALYHTRDLHAPGDGGWLSPYMGPDGWADAHAPIGSARVARDGDHVLIATWGNGLYLTLRVAERLQREGITCRVLDLRWLAPLPVDDLLTHAADVGRVVVVDETRHQGGVGEAIVTALVECGFAGPIARVAAHDSFVPLGDAANLVLVSEDDIADAVRAIRKR
ncbi:MAG: thiamine pyrophosphate-dependent enzyme [Acidimicrobiales bacterium]